MENYKKSMFQLSGALFIITCINKLWGISIYSHVDFRDVLMLLSIGFIAAALFMKRKDKLLGIALGINAIVAFANYFLRFSHYSITNIVKDLYFFSTFLKMLLEFLIPALLCIFIFFEKKLSAIKKQIALICAYLPVALIFATVIKNSYYLKEEYYSWRGYVFFGDSGYLDLFFQFIFTTIAAFGFICISSILTDKVQNEISAKRNKLGIIGFIALPTGTLLGFLIAFISNLIFKGVQFFNDFFLIGVLWVAVLTLVIAGVCLSPLAILYPANLSPSNNNESSASDILSSGYINLGKHIALCLFTFGVWNFIWIYRTTNLLNRMPKAEQFNPTSTLLLCMFVPFYSIYWYYKNAERIDRLSQLTAQNQSNMATTCLILSIFIPIVACILMQDRINSLCSAAKPINQRSTPPLEEKRWKALNN